MGILNYEACNQGVINGCKMDSLDSNSRGNNDAGESL